MVEEREVSKNATKDWEDDVTNDNRCYGKLLSGSWEVLQRDLRRRRGLRGGI